MRRLLRGTGRLLGALWTGLSWAILIAVGIHMGQWIGYGKGVRDTARLVIEMRHGGYAVDDPWDRGDI